MSDEIKKSNYGPKGTAAGAQYQAHANQERKANNTGDTVEGNGKNKNVKSYSSKPGQLSAKQQAAKENGKRRVKKLSGPVTTLTREQIAAIMPSITPIDQIKKDEMLEVEPDGKQELVEGKESLKKDPKKRWASLKKALDHKKAFMDLEGEMSEDDNAGAEQPPPDQQQPGQPPQEEQQPQGDDAAAMQKELAPSDGEEQAKPDQDQGEDAGSPPEAVSGGQEGEQEQPEQQEPEEDKDEKPVDPEELAEALKNEGYTEQEIAYIVHGHHSPEVDPTQQAKAQATAAMSDLDVDSSAKMAQLEHAHAEQSMAAEREHKKRMSELDYMQTQKKHALADKDIDHKQRMADLEYQQAQQANPQAIEQAHKQRMLDLEYEKAKRDSSVDETSGDAEANKQMKMLEVEKKRLELKLRQEEMKMELEFKKREHELKLKMMEQQFKEQGQRKSEISGIKHEQKLSDTLNPPKPDNKKPLKKNEEDNE